jgi:hypothetical protein
MSAPVIKAALPEPDDQAADFRAAKARDLIGQPRTQVEIERIAHLRPVEPQHGDLVRRAFDQQRIRRSHGVWSIANAGRLFHHAGAFVS